MSNQLAHGDLFKNLYKREACGMSAAQREARAQKLRQAIGLVENLRGNLRHQQVAATRLKKLLKMQLESLQ